MKRILTVVMAVAIVVIGLVIYLQNTIPAEAQQQVTKKITRQQAPQPMVAAQQPQTPAQPAPAQPTLEERVKTLEEEMAKANYLAIIFKKTDDANAEATATNAKAITANTKSIASNTTTIDLIVAETKANAKAIGTNVLAIATNAEATKVNAATLVVHDRTLRDHESRITNAQKSANRALGVALMMATGMTPEEAKTKVNAFVVGDLNLGKLAVLAHKIPQGIQKAQATAKTANTTARTGLELLCKHGSKGWIFSHDKKLAKAAEEALAK